MRAPPMHARLVQRLPKLFKACVCLRTLSLDPDSQQLMFDKAGEAAAKIGFDPWDHKHSQAATLPGDSPAISEADQTADEVTNRS